MIEVKVEKISFYPPSKGYAVLLKEAVGDRFLPVIVGSFEAQSIALALEDVQMPRPMTHDLLCAIVDDLGAEINEVFISELSEGTFFSRINITGQQGERDIDARPSDAISLALRVGAPIFVADSVMEEAGIHEMADQAEEQLPDQKEADPPSDAHLKQLEVQLDRAVGAEEYEQAAKIRDKIKKLQATAGEPGR